MLIELFPLQLAFRGLSDEDPDEITIDSPDVDEDEDEDDPLDSDAPEAGTGDEPLE